MDKDFGLMCVCAERYALGRQTYIVSSVVDFIIRNLNSIPKRDLRVMMTDIDRALENGEVGDENIDAPRWRDLLVILEGKAPKML